MKYPILDGYITSTYGLRKRKIDGILTEEFHHGIDISSKDSLPIIMAVCSMTVGLGI